MLINNLINESFSDFTSEGLYMLSSTITVIALFPHGVEINFINVEVSCISHVNEKYSFTSVKTFYLRL